MKIKNYEELLQSSELRDSIRSKEVCLFLGAGVASNLGMPNWNGLAKDITQYCTKNKIFKHSIEQTLLKINDPLKIISYCCQEIEQKFLNKKYYSFEEKNKLIASLSPLLEINIYNAKRKYKQIFKKVWKNLIKNEIITKDIEMPELSANDLPLIQLR